jgi:hypothetical protein
LPIYVDRLRVFDPRRACGLPTCHLATDGSLEELHAFARTIGVPSLAFHGDAKFPHYDLRERHRALAVAHGALEVSSKELVRILTGRR